MIGANRKRTVLVSTAIILLCLSVIVGMTWALFTDTRSLNNHLKAGDMSITLLRTELTKTMLNEKGYLDTIEIQKATDDPVDFTTNKPDDTADDNVFGIAEGEIIVPGTKYVAVMQIENHSDVAFGYWIEIKCDDESKLEDLAQQLKVTVTTDSDSYDFVANGLTVKPEKGYIEAVAVRPANADETDTTGIAKFTVTVEFVDLGVNDDFTSDNNLAKEDTVEFDIVVNAVQLTTDPNSTPTE